MTKFAEGKSPYQMEIPDLHTFWFIADQVRRDIEGVGYSFGEAHRLHAEIIAKADEHNKLRVDTFIKARPETVVQ